MQRYSTREDVYGSPIRQGYFRIARHWERPASQIRVWWKHQLASSDNSAVELDDDTEVMAGVAKDDDDDDEIAGPPTGGGIFDYDGVKRDY